jgi:molybdate-binding protein
MSHEEREQTRKDWYGTTIITKEYTKPQLIQLLERERGIVSPKGNKQQIQDMA